jgi:hypothetical protein
MSVNCDWLARIFAGARGSLFRGAERTELNYVRRCHVSQRFRAFMEKHKVSGSFRPVEIVDD